MSLLLLTLLISCGTIAAYHFWFAPPPLKIATIDLQGFILTQKQALVKGEITEEQFRTNLDRLEQTIKAVPPGELVFIQEVVLRGGKRLEIPVVSQSPTTFQEQMKIGAMVTITPLSGAGAARAYSDNYYTREEGKDYGAWAGGGLKSLASLAKRWILMPSKKF